MTPAPQLPDRIRTSVADRIYEQIREAILTGELPLGSRHSIYKLADEYGVSRTPVRDAVLRLADTGLLLIERNRGVVIQGFSADDIRKVFEARLLIEVPAAAFAATWATEELLQTLDDLVAELHAAVAAHDVARFMVHDRALHAAIIGASGNQRLVDFVAGLRDVVQSWNASTIDRSRDLRAVEHEHVPIVAAIRARDARAAGEHMQRHLTETMLLLTRQAPEAAAAAAPQMSVDWR